jgi:hypothetical protein
MRSPEEILRARGKWREGNENVENNPEKESN